VERRTTLVQVMAARRRRGGRGADEGFTLAEMLVALGIVATGVLALLGGFIAAANSIRAQQEDARAVRVALDQYETLRLRDWQNDPDLSVGVHTGTARGSNGITYSYRTTITLRDIKPGGTAPGNQVKDLVTEVTWRTNGRTRTITYRTSMAQDPRSIGGRSGYIQAIKSMTVAPEPSVIVNYDGYTVEPIYITIEMSGFATQDELPITWSDGNGARSVTALSTDGRYWRATIPAGTSGIRILNPQTGVATTLRFSTVNRAGQVKSSDLQVFGPPNNPPVIDSFTVTPNPVRVYNGGQNKDKNQTDVTFSCAVSGLDPSAGSLDQVTVKYYEASGPKEQSLTKPTGTATAWTWTFARDTTFFASSATGTTTFTYTCVVRRASDGGPASKTLQVQIGRFA
jgi:type II secretory pathway pseudopilin PulG